MVLDQYRTLSSNQPQIRSYFRYFSNSKQSRSRGYVICLWMLRRRKVNKKSCLVSWNFFSCLIEFKNLSHVLCKKTLRVPVFFRIGKFDLIWGCVRKPVSNNATVPLTTFLCLFLKLYGTTFTYQVAMQVYEKWISKILVHNSSRRKSQ